MSFAIRCFSLYLLLGLIPQVAAALPTGFEQHIFNGAAAKSMPGGIVRFHVMNFDCSQKDYGDGRGESNCTNGNVSSRLAGRALARAGTSREYSAEINVDPGFAYLGDRLDLMMWQRVNVIKNEMYFLKLDARRGLTFQGKTCAAPKRFGSWVKVDLRVHWSNGPDGKFVLTCDDKTIASWNGPNLVPPDCGTSRNDECVLKLQDLSEPVQWQIGPFMGGRGQAKPGERMGKFEPIQPDGITIDMRAIYMGPPR